jgi:hypothetical protein
MWQDAFNACFFPIQTHQEFTLTQSDREVAYAVGGLFRDTDYDRQAVADKVVFC